MRAKRRRIAPPSAAGSSVGGPGGVSSSISSNTPSSYASARAFPSNIHDIRSLRYAGSRIFSIRSPRPSTTVGFVARGLRGRLGCGFSSSEDTSTIQSPSSTSIGKCKPRTCHSVSISRPSTVPRVRRPRDTLEVPLELPRDALTCGVPREPQPPPHISPSHPPRTSRQSMSWIAYERERPPGAGRIR